MPQHSMFPTDRRLTGLDISLRDRTLDLLDALDVSCIQHYDSGAIATVSSVRLVGRQVDYLDTLVQEATHAFMYGEAGDVARAVARVHRDARRHSRTIDRVGS